MIGMLFKESLCAVVFVFLNGLRLAVIVRRHRWRRADIVARFQLRENCTSGSVLSDLVL